MFYEQIHTSVIDDESIPWVPFEPYNNDVLLKYFKADPIRGETITLLKAPAGAQLPKHHHSGTAIVYTIKGSWKYLEHDWIAGPGSIVFETAASRTGRPRCSATRPIARSPTSSRATSRHSTEVAHITIKNLRGKRRVSA